jgi:ribosome biogenesis GTPase / thiamine phosphate phosphatase
MWNLLELGWRPFFAAQLDAADEYCLPARVMAVHRGRVELAGAEVAGSFLISSGMAATGIAVGDWVLIEQQSRRLRRVLDRSGAFRRRAAGDGGRMQVLAANVDTVLLVTSANRDFNIARLERYLALAHDATAWPVMVITKTDETASAGAFVKAARRLSPGLEVRALDARDADAVQVLTPWCGAGQTVALLGSSGVGKSTLVNSLAGTAQDTAAVRTDDQRGRHTTTSRSMHRLPQGGWLIDTPGMREIRLAEMAEAIDDVFADVQALAKECRFGDCRHGGEPGCAVQAALAAGNLEAERLRRYGKLQAEDRRNSESIAERRHRDRTFGRFAKSVMRAKRREQDGEH